MLSKNGYAGEARIFKLSMIESSSETATRYPKATAFTTPYGNGLSILASYPEFAFDMKGWDKKSLEEKCPAK